MARPDKAATVGEISDRFRASNAAVLTEYRGLTVAQLTRLRTSIGGHATYAVVKNTLAAIAAREAGVTAVDGADLAGPTAIAFVTGDPVEAAKGLRDFARANPALVIKGGVLEGRPLTADEVRRLADLESREVLLAKLAGAMKASLTQAVYLFAAPLTQAARTIDALRAKQAEGAPASAADGATPAATVPDGAPPDVPVDGDAPSTPAADGEQSPAPTADGEQPTAPTADGDVPAAEPAQG